MAGGTSVPERSRAARETQRFGTIVVVGGGCYGGYYVRQLARAERAGALAWDTLIVVDRDARCPVALLAPDQRPSAMRVEAAEWHAWFAEYLGEAAAGPATHERDAIVPSPLMPHLMADWLADRARARWPSRRIGTEPLVRAPAVPWQRAGDDGTHFVSFAEWMCPINCIEPARCPHTRGERSWSMPPALATYAEQEAAAGRPLEGPFVFHCAHRAYGVGMLDVRDILAADRAIAARGELPGRFELLVGTASHCHGAVRRIVVE
jgi:hypothetical protein